jgi:hypothetical protein
MSTLGKFIAAGLIYAVWFFLVMFHGASQAEFITWLQYALGFIGGAHFIPPIFQTYTNGVVQTKIAQSKTQQ